MLSTPLDLSTEQVVVSEETNEIYLTLQAASCPSQILLSDLVRSYHTFSPLLFPFRKKEVIFCDSTVPKIDWSPLVKWCSALPCPDFPL